MTVLSYIAFLCLDLLCGLLNAFAGTVLWAWFITPAFGIASPSLSLMFGIMIFAALFKSSTVKREESISKMYSLIIVKPLTALFFGWIIHFFI